MSGEARTLGSYVLGATLGRGATSEVFAARHRDNDDIGDVAIKCQRAGDAERFIAEANRLRAIEHRNVVRVLDAGRDDTHGSYLVMERVDGVTLAARISSGLDEAEIRRIGASIADGVAAAHARGIIHRDLKPTNVMIDSRGTPKLVDFGIASSLGDIEIAARIGTLAYMAPEQLADALVAPSVDIWALGVILFEAATGRLPFEDFTGGRRPQLVDTAPSARLFAAISPALDSVIRACLERDPSKRPASMVEVAAALRDDAPERITQLVDTPEQITQLVDAPARPPQARRRRMWPWLAGTIAAVAIAYVAWPPRGTPASLPVAVPVVTPVVVPVPALANPSSIAPAPHAVPRPGEPHGAPVPATSTPDPARDRRSTSRPGSSPRRAGETLD